LDEGIGGETIRQGNEILVKTPANRRENGGRKQLISRINLELEKPCMRDIWENGWNNNKTVWLMCRHRRTNYGSYDEKQQLTNTA
jgi:hypothetical protein